MTEFLLLDNGGVMTSVRYRQHLDTIKHYNRLVDHISKYQEGTSEYNTILEKMNHLKEYIDNDLKRALNSADRLINKEN